MSGHVHSWCPFQEEKKKSLLNYYLGVLLSPRKWIHVCNGPWRQQIGFQQLVCQICNEKTRLLGEMLWKTTGTTTTHSNSNRTQIQLMTTAEKLKSIQCSSIHWKLKDYSSSADLHSNIWSKANYTARMEMDPISMYSCSKSTMSSDMGFTSLYRLNILERE